MKKFLLASILSLALINTQAQEIIPCATDQVHYQMKQANPLLAIEEERGNQEASKIAEALLANRSFAKQGNVKYIPVVFHVIHNGGPENITQAQIMDQMRILNEDFRKKSGTNGDKSTNPNAADMEFEFRLAQVDPNGNRHDGINRIQSTATENASDNVKSLSRWNSAKYLNIWVVKSITLNGGGAGTILGYAQFPSYMTFAPSLDGIVIRADYVGSIQSGNSSHMGRTLTHEVGHWVGLYHPFQDGCTGQTGSDCSSAGDRVCDTPPVESANYGSLCDAVVNSCAGDSPDLPDMITNYMDYLDGKCANNFTLGQKARATALMLQFRSLIYSDANLAAAGILPDGSYATVNASTIKAPYSYGFEDANVTTAGWRIQNLQNGVNGWKIDNIGYNGTKSIAFRNYNYTATTHSRDEFNSPLIDISTLANPVLKVRVANARKTSGDVLEIGISGDFGRTETKIYSAAPALSMPTTELAPTETSQWTTLTFDLTPYRNMTNARVRFELRNLRGNNTFIDDFSITSSTGLLDNLKQEMAFNVYPNPMEGTAYAQFELKQSQNIEINICDVTGKKITTIQQGEMQAGMHSLAINRSDLKAGIYLINVTTQNGTFAHKLVVN
jgi:hypothetical protein